MNKNCTEQFCFSVNLLVCAWNMKSSIRHSWIYKQELVHFKKTAHIQKGTYFKGWKARLHCKTYCRNCLTSSLNVILSVHIGKGSICCITIVSKMNQTTETTLFSCKPFSLRMKHEIIDPSFMNVQTGTGAFQKDNTHSKGAYFESVHCKKHEKGFKILLNDRLVHCWIELILFCISARLGKQILESLRVACFWWYQTAIKRLGY